MNEPVQESFVSKDYERLVQRLISSDANIVVIFAAQQMAEKILEKVSATLASQRFTWIASDTWARSLTTARKFNETVAGMFGVSPLLQNLSRGTDVRLVFKNNSADDAGSVLYGGAIDNCKLTGLDSYSSGEVFDMIVHIEDGNDYSTTSKISSDPLRICPCKNNLPDCSRSWDYRATVPYPHTVYPGETFQISVVAAGQRNGTVSSTVRSTVRTNTIMDISPVNLLDYQYLQQTNNTCTKLNYTVFSLSQKVRILLHPESSPCSSGSIYFLLKLNQTCPPGFNNSESARSCICEPRLAQYTHQCNLTNGLGQISRDADKTFWVGYNSQSHEVVSSGGAPTPAGTSVFTKHNWDMGMGYLWLNGWGIYHLMGGAFMAYWVGHL